MDQFIPERPVRAGWREDWRWFNQAVEARAAWLKDQVVPRAQPTPAADWLRRGLGIGCVVIAAGAAAALVLWVLRPPTQVFAGVPALPPSVPSASVVVDYTKFVTVTLAGTPSLRSGVEGFAGMKVVTGWNYSTSEAARPVNQYCYVSIGKSAVGSLRVDIADTGVGVRPFDAELMAPLTPAEFRTAQSNCVWAPGTTLPAARAGGATDRAAPLVRATHSWHV